MRALDVGSGSGYLTSVFSHMVGQTGKAIGIEHIPDLVEESLKNTKKDPKTAPLLKSGVMELHLVDGREGYQSEAPYNCIHVGAAAPSIPSALTEQLAPGGRLVVPVGKEGQNQ